LFSNPALAEKKTASAGSTTRMELDDFGQAGCGQVCNTWSFKRIGKLQTCSFVINNDRRQGKAPSIVDKPMHIHRIECAELPGLSTTRFLSS